MAINDIDCRNGFAEDPIIIIGTGPVGMKMASELIQTSPEQPIVLFGDEPCQPYNRVGLSSFLAGEIGREALNNELSHQNLIQHHNCKIKEINRDKQFVIDETGKRHFYRTLILATGSRPHKPSIPGIHLPHVFTFRDMRDVEELFARRVKSRCTVIIGGGLLGLEAARAMQKHNTNVVLIEHSVRLMAKQLNNEISQRLFDEILGLGIEVRLRVFVSGIEGDIGVTGVKLSDGTTIDCDTVILATGIVPNKELALDSGLAVSRGIKVNETLSTSDPNIYAVGECCEFNGDVYGLVAPGFEQAAIVAHALKGEKVKYQGSLNVAKLKLFGLPVFSVGVVGDEAESVSNSLYTYSDNTNIRTLVVRHRRIIGAMGIGLWNEFERIQEVIGNKRRVWPWQLLAFQSNGSLWNDDGFDVSQWPFNATVCSCKGVSRGEISECILQGANSLESITACTGASSVCGSCRPLVANLLGAEQKLEPQTGHKSLLASSLIISLVLLLWLLAPPINYAASVQVFSLDFLWTDFLYKQISGYSLAGLILLSIIGFSLRKRISKFTFGQAGHWRIAHTIAGGFALLVLIAHTGLNTGDKLNFYLLMSFIFASVIGVVSAYLVAQEHKLPPLKIKRWRVLVNRAHIIVVWPIPVLLGFHITSVYYF